jgi:chromosome segregation ATPase
MKTVGTDSIKAVIEFGTKSIELVTKLGGIIPVLLAIGAALAVIKMESILTGIGAIASLIMNALFPSLVVTEIGIVNIETQLAATTAQTALATGGISLLVGALVLLLFNLDKISPSMSNLNEEFKKSYDITSKHIDDLKSLSSEYETLANKSDKSADDIARLLDIQTILNTQYGYSATGVNAYSAAIDGNSKAIQKNIDWMKKKADQEATEYISSHRSDYNSAKEYFKNPTPVSKMGYDYAEGRNPKEAVEYLNKLIAANKNLPKSYTDARDAIQKEIDASNEIIINYDHYTNVLNANTIAKKENNKETPTKGTLVHTADELKALTDASDEATSSVVSTADSIKSLINSLDDSKTASIAQVEQLKKMFPETYMQALTFEGDQIKVNTEALKIMSIAKAETAVVTTQAAVDAINSDIKESESAISAAQVIISANQAVVNSQTGLSIAYLQAAQDAIGSANAQVEAAKAIIEKRKIDLNIANSTNLAAQQYVNQLKSTSYWSKDAAKSTGKLTDAKKEAYQDEIKGYEKQKKALENQKKALEDQKDAYKDIIDAMKEKLKLQKEESDFQDELADKNKELADIENELFAIQFDNSQEATAKRLQLEEEKAEKMEEIAQLQADRTYDIQIEALDKEYDAFADMIDKQISAIDNMITKFNDMIEKINEAIDALSRLASAGTGGGTSTGTGKRKRWVPAQYTPEKHITLPNGQTQTEEAHTIPGYWEYYHKGGLVGANGNNGQNSNEVFAKLLKGEYVSTEAQMKGFLTDVLPRMLNMNSNIEATNSGGSNGISMGDVVIQVSGNLDKSVIPNIKSAVFEVLNQTNNMRGKRTNSFANSI